MSVKIRGISNILILFDVNRAHGYSSEDVQMVIESMAAQGKEPTFCMGDDAPLAILSQKSHMLYDYFKQRFAQVYKVCFSYFYFVMDKLARGTAISHISSSSILV